MRKVEPIRDKAKIEELTSWYKKKSDRDALLFLLGINTALRISDMLPLRYTDVFNGDQLFRDYLIIKVKKTGKTTKFKLNTKIRKEMFEYCKVYGLDGDDYFFFSFRSPNRPIDRTQAWRVLKATPEALENFILGGLSLLANG